MSIFEVRIIRQLAERIMKKITALLFMAGLLLAGCVKTVNRPELYAAIHSHDRETASWVSYIGSKDGFHYIRHGHTLGSDIYRIAESDLKIDDPFPLTKDEGKWRNLKENGEFWGKNGKFFGKLTISTNSHVSITIITNNQQSGTPLPRAPQVGHSEGGR